MLWRIVLGLLALIPLLLLLRWLSRQPWNKLRQYLLQGAIVTFCIALVVLTATGRLHWLGALVGAAVPVALRFLPWMMRGLSLYQSARASGASKKTSARSSEGQRSKVQTAYLLMSLDHDSGHMRGKVLQGRFRDAHLSELNLAQLLELREECRRDDEDSVNLLEAYLDRMHGDTWREQAEAHGADRDSERSGGADAAPEAGRMTPQQARQILGLGPDADDKAVVDAHRRLIQKLHPDRGGSSFLAATINQAKEVLLGH